MDTVEVTQRDIEVARQMEAPQDVIARLEEGAWPSDQARYAVRNAEACIDYLEGRYGVSFSPIRASGTTWMSDYEDVYLRVESGPFAGEEVHARYDSGMRDGAQAAEPAFEETYYYVANHGEWERIASEAAAPALSSLPEGTWALDVQMTRQLYTQEQSAVPILEGGGTGEVRVYVAADAAGLSDEALGLLLDGLADALCGTSLHGICEVQALEGPLPAGGLAIDAAQSGGLGSGWYGFAVFDGPTKESWS